MQFDTYSHKFAAEVVKSAGFKTEYAEIEKAIKSISDYDLERRFSEIKKKRKKAKSISEAINELLKEKLEAKGWLSEAAIFRDEDYTKKRETRWRLDFAKKNIAIEVAFNHGEATAHNLIKPVLSSELNHVEKDVQTKMGVVIAATQEMKKAGGFDGAVGTYEKFISYLRPYNNILTVPIMLIGLKPPKTFRMEKKGKIIKI